MSRGRPTKYKKSYIDEGHRLCLQGYDDEQLAIHFGVHRSTLAEWKTKHKNFRDSLLAGKDIYDSKIVERCLLDRATGYKVTETRIEQDHEGNIKKVKTTREIAPDVRAQMYWLNNRSAKRWQNASKVEVDVNNDSLGSIQDIYKASKK